MWKQEADEAEVAVTMNREKCNTADLKDEGSGPNAKEGWWPRRGWEK